MIKLAINSLKSGGFGLVKRLFRPLMANESGAALTEYALLLGFIALVTIMAAMEIAPSVEALLNRATFAIESVQAAVPGVSRPPQSRPQEPDDSQHAEDSDSQHAEDSDSEDSDTSQHAEDSDSKESDDSRHAEDSDSEESDDRQHAEDS
jgi:Flp pilus assembly pilin Flp